MWMLNRMGILGRRCISAILKSGLRSAATNRTMSSSPMLMIGRGPDEEGGAMYRAWNCAEDRYYTFYDNKRKRGSQNFMWYMEAEETDVEAVGSSQGWLAYQSPLRGLFLVDPIRYRYAELPGTSDMVYSVVLDPAGRAFMISGPQQRLSFCWAGGRSRHWTLLSSDSEEPYENVVYSAKRQRLLCLTRSLKIKVWDVGGAFPRLDYVMELRERVGSKSSDDGYARVAYVASVENCEDGGLIVVTRGIRSSGFVVYRVDGEELVRMEDSLEGMCVFVGANETIALMVKESAGDLHPNSIYYTHDRRIVYTRDIHVFDYQKREKTDLLFHFLMKYDISELDPVWFIPPPSPSQSPSSIPSSGSPPIVQLPSYIFY